MVTRSCSCVAELDSGVRRQSGRHGAEAVVDDDGAAGTDGGAGVDGAVEAVEDDPEERGGR